MKWEITNLQTRLYFITVIVLLVGLGAALLIYLAAENERRSDFGYEIVNGQAYPINPQDSKMYRRNLELYGGKWNVLADEFTNWFVGLWHGKLLAFTVASLTLLISSGFFFVAQSLPSGLETDVRNENNRSEKK